MLRYRFVLTLLVGALALSLQVCGGGGSSGTDTGPTVPVPVPEPTPEPTPPPEEPLSASCAVLGPGVRDEEATCTAGPATFLEEMNLAIAQVRNTHPDYFDGRNVLNVGGYYVEIVRALDRMGLCAETGGEEVGVKISEAFNDQFDILSARSEVRTGDNIYLGSCSPAVIQGGPRPHPPVPEGCSLPQSTYLACGRPESRFINHVDAAIQRMIDENPEMFDFDDINPGTDWPRVNDIKAYQLGVVQILTEQGYCAFFDSEEIQMKRTNEFSEHYDINYSDEYVRRGNGSYRGSCYPAAF